MGRAENNGRNAAPVSIRLQVFLAKSGVASRRAAERLIQEGRVTVNGTVITELGTKVGLSDRIEFDGRKLHFEERKRYILLYKPAGYLCAMSDPEGRQLAVDLLRENVAERVYNVGRLDQWSSGLVLFTNDGDLAAIMGHPSGGVDKEYEVVADAPLDNSFFEAFRHGITIEGVRYLAREAERTGPDSARIVLAEGKNREIRRVLKIFDRRALFLRRIRIGPIGIGNLPEGGWRELESFEVEALRSYGSKAREGLPASAESRAGPPRH
jgi:23S rRNA pseudouridine2605 synthase